MSEFIKDMIQADGGLHDLSRYVNWWLGSETVVLDGNFTAQELREIADYMDPKHRSQTGHKRPTGTVEKPQQS